MFTPLKPCPYCEHLHLARCEQGNDLFSTGDAYWVNCPKCEMHGPESPTEDGSVAAWNALPRPSDVAALRARIAKLEAAAQPARPPGDLHWLLATADYVDADDPERPVYYGVRDGERWAACSNAGAKALCECHGWTPDKPDT